MESAEKFLNMEIEEKLNQRSYGGYAYWTYNRFDLFNMIDVLVNERNSQGFPIQITRMQKYKRYLKILFNKKYNIYHMIKGGEILVFNHQRRVKNGNHYECVYTDDIVTELNNVRVLEAPYQKMHYQPTRTQHLVYLDRMDIYYDFRFSIYRFLQRKQFKKDKEELGNISKELVSLVKSYFSIDLKEDRIAEYLFTRYCDYKCNYKSIQKIFDIMRPKVVLECASYCTTNVMIANEIAKQRGIPTLELQHGVMGKNHMGYNYQEKGICQFPDKMLTYSEYWNQVTRLPLDKENIIACGYPYFEKNVKRMTEDSNRERNKIIFVSQTVIGMILSKFAVGLFELMKDNSDYEFVYKLHPGEYKNWKKMYPELINSGIKIIDNNERSIYEWFAESCIQIGVFSTAIYEGLGFGLQTFLVKAYRSEDMEELCELGYAKMVEKPEEIVKYLADTNNKENNELDKFWKINSVENIINVVEDSYK